MMARHVVTSGPVDHDGARYEEGDELNLAIDAAATLVAAGTVQAVQAAKGGKATTEPRD